MQICAGKRREREVGGLKNLQQVKDRLQFTPSFLPPFYSFFFTPASLSDPSIKNFIRSFQSLSVSHSQKSSQATRPTSSIFPKNLKSNNNKSDCRAPFFSFIPFLLYQHSFPSHLIFQVFPFHQLSLSIISSKTDHKM